MQTLFQRLNSGIAFGQSGAVAEDPSWPVPTSADAVFLPALDLDGSLGPAPAVHLLWRPCGSDGEGLTVWRADGFADEDDARDLHGWMMSVPGRWDAWGRIALGLGAELLAKVIGAEAAEHAERVAVEREREAAKLAARSQVWCGCDDRERHPRGRIWSLYLERGGDGRERLVGFAFDTRSERDRLWDWMRHQTGRYVEFAELFEASGKEALRAVLFAGMLETERDVRRAGLSSGRGRPLRFWPGPRA